MHAGYFEASVTAIGIHENVIEIVAVRQKVFPTFGPTLLVAPEKCLVHGPPNVFKLVRVDVVRERRPFLFSARCGHGFPA